MKPTPGEGIHVQQRRPPVVRGRIKRLEMIKKYLETIRQVIAQGPYKPGWDSLAGHKAPSWYCKGKFGIFIHWGIYSVPAFGNEWYSRNMYNAHSREFEHHRKTWGEQKDFGYKDFIPLFKGENFDASRWAEAFSKAGARFVMPVAEHHDGFAMYDTDFNRWNALAMGPCRDVIGELKAAVEREGMTFCVSTHRAEHYFFMNQGRLFDSDVNDERYADFYGPAVDMPEFGALNLGDTTEDPAAVGASPQWLTDWMVRTCELIDRYQPASLYFDWWIHNHSFEPYLKKIAAYYYNRAVQWGMEVTINFKHKAFPRDVAVFDVERGALTDISPLPWQTDTAIGKHSWGYREDNEYKTSRQIICDLIDVVSKNGMLLLNLGPKPDGTFTAEEIRVLEDVGAWLRINGAGIYDTTPWHRFGEGEINCAEGQFQDGDEKAYTAADFRFTRKGQTLYAFQLRPKGDEVCIRSLALADGGALVKSVTALGQGERPFFQTAEGLQISPVVNEGLPVCYEIQFERGRR